VKPARDSIRVLFDQLLAMDSAAQGCAPGYRILAFIATAQTLEALAAMAASARCCSACSPLPSNHWGDIVAPIRLHAPYSTARSSARPNSPVQLDEQHLAPSNAQSPLLCRLGQQGRDYINLLDATMNAPVLMKARFAAINGGRGLTCSDRAVAIRC